MIHVVNGRTPLSLVINIAEEEQFVLFGSQEIAKEDDDNLQYYIPNRARIVGRLSMLKIGSGRGRIFVKRFQPEKMKVLKMNLMMNLLLTLGCMTLKSMIWVRELLI